MAAKRRRLVQRRKNLGFTQESLAAALEVDRTTIERWENGHREPQPWMRPRLAATLQVSTGQLDQLLTMLDTAAETSTPITPDWAAAQHPHDLKRLTADTARPDFAEIDDMQRRELLRLFSMVGTALTLPTATAPCRSVPIADYARLNGHLWQVYNLTPTKADVLPLVRQQLGVLADGLTHPHGPDMRRQLCRLTGDLCQLAGEIFFDANSYTDAAHCYTLAAHVSKDADAFDLWACAMARHAYLSVYERRFADAVPMLDLAAALARRGNNGLSTRHWVAAVQAETYAGLGDLAACQRALDAAEQVRQLSGPVHNGGWLRFDGSRLAEERGTCYLRLGRIDLAETALTDALPQATTPRRRAGVLTDLAAIGAQHRDPDQVITYAAAALDQMRQTGSGVISRKLTELQHQLSPLLTNTRIQQLNADITALTTIAT